MAVVYNGVPLPSEGSPIRYENGQYRVPDNPIIPFIEGDGTGRDIWKASRRVFDAAVEKAYGGKRHVVWYEIFAGEKAFSQFRNWMPEDTLRAAKDLRVSIKGPLTTPVGGEEMLAGGKKRVREDSGVGIKPISITGTKRLVRRAIQFALENKRPSVTLVHKGNIQKFTEGAFREWGYEVAQAEFRDRVVTERESWILDNKDKSPQITIEQNAQQVEPGLEFAAEEFRKGVHAEVKDVLDKLSRSHGNGQWKKKLMINDRIADSIFQQVIIRPQEYSVLATPNLNGDYISDACAAQVGGLGIAPGGNIGDGYAIFEATHGTAPKYADLDVINPGSVILSGVMMFELIGWREAARLIENALEETIRQKRVTYDFERQMEGATKVKTSEFASYMIGNMDALAGARREVALA
ncbi:MAG: NADP-dependent isocitrate dehydrogenase [Acidobacteria bacterium]|nr:MAG: NADP-dependent isocitrate dehydrogenase [Acidobacteriota bacterium]